MATIGLWVRSYWTVDCPAVTRWVGLHKEGLDDQWSMRHLWLSSDQGKITLGVQSEWTEFYGGYPGATFHPEYPGRTEFSWHPSDTDLQDYYGYCSVDRPARWYLLDCTWSNRLSDKGMYVYRAPDHLFYSRSAYLIAPQAAAMVLFALCPATWFTLRLRATSTKRVGLCPKCNYDLRATPDKCPECGTAKRPPSPKDPSAVSGT
jgi:hypothetical protein